jgi:hypothetical protein
VLALRPAAPASAAARGAPASLWELASLAEGPPPARPAPYERNAEPCDERSGGGLEETRGVVPAAPPGPSGGGGRPAGARRRHRASRAGKGRARPAMRGGETRTCRVGRSRPLRALSDKELLIRPCPGRPPPWAPLRSALTERHSVNLGRAAPRRHDALYLRRKAPASGPRARSTSVAMRRLAPAGPSAPLKGGSPERRRRGPRCARAAPEGGSGAVAASAAPQRSGEHHGRVRQLRGSRRECQTARIKMSSPCSS